MKYRVLYVNERDIEDYAVSLHHLLQDVEDDETYTHEMRSHNGELVGTIIIEKGNK